MQLFGLVNELLAQHKNNAEVDVSRVDDLTLQRYAVVPLTENIDVIGWVEGCDTLHSLVSGYRGPRHIPDMLELSLMQAALRESTTGKFHHCVPSTTSCRNRKCFDLLETTRAVTIWPRACGSRVPTPSPGLIEEHCTLALSHSCLWSDTCWASEIVILRTLCYNEALEKSYTLILEIAGKSHRCVICIPRKFRFVSPECWSMQWKSVVLTVHFAARANSCSVCFVKIVVVSWRCSRRLCTYCSSVVFERSVRAWCSSVVFENVIL